MIWNSNTSIIAGISFTLIGIQVLFDNYNTDQTKHDRFARRGYVATGGMLESEAIGEIIHSVFCKSRLVTLGKDETVPKPLVALTYVLVRHIIHVRNY